MRQVSHKIEDRLIVALDVPSLAAAREMVARLDGIVSFFNKAAVEGRGSSDLKIFTITALTSLDDEGLRGLGYLVPVDKLIELRVRNTVECGADGIIASAMDNPDRLRALAGARDLLVATPGIRFSGAALDDHKRSGTPAQAIRDGADYLVVGRPIIRDPDPARQALAIIEDMRKGLGA
jgi:orotidine-5'-phosphate decarboxylase